MTEKRSVMLGMSGGVDSSAAALILQQQGYEVCGVTLHLFDKTQEDEIDKTKSCCSLSDVQDARAVADKLGMTHHVFNFKDVFKTQVMDRFAQSYQKGQTPNPCIDCNRYVKFDKMLQRAQLLGYDYIATGHYARNEYNPETQRWELKKGLDETKDQSYVLYCLTQEQLAHTLFPLGGYTKTYMRELAAENGLVNARKPDSQDICFVSSSYDDFLKQEYNVQPVSGSFVDKNGKKLGIHKGIISYTVGQRKGLGLAVPSPLYVIDKDPAANTVVLAEKEDTFAKGVLIEDINLIAIEHLTGPVKVAVRTRYKQKEIPAVLQPGKTEGIAEIIYDEPATVAAAGQAAVCYVDDVVLGGGTIRTNIF